MRVFLSFLGLGAAKGAPNPTDFVYEDVIYRYNGQECAKSPYVQESLLHALQLEGKRPDLVLLAMTELSKEWQWEREGRLKSRLQDLAHRIRSVDISDAFDSGSQWATFEKLLDAVPTGAELYVDVTHGFRLMPILFSAAISFLVNAKNVRLGGVYYGAYEPRKPGPFDIVDMTDFYRVNQWAEAVKALVTTGDARSLVTVAADSPSFQAGALRNEELAASLQRLSLFIRNVDAHAVPDAAREAIELVRRVKAGAGQEQVTARLLLDTLEDQFAQLALAEPLSGRYDEPYFRSQIALVRVLNSYGLLMQSFTVMRELIGSIGITGYAKVRDKGRLLEGRRYADQWVNLCQFDEAWTPQNTDIARMAENLRPLQALLKETGDWRVLTGLAKGVVDHRNAFDHARMSPKAARGDDPGLQAAADEALGTLSVVVGRLVDAGVIQPSKSRG
jgi:CRISPR-associated Csx2 family protein